MAKEINGIAHNITTSIRRFSFDERMEDLDEEFLSEILIYELKIKNKSSNLWMSDPKIRIHLAQPPFVESQINRPRFESKESLCLLFKFYL
ncbi:MAG: hypothetical protein BGO55_01510 [Sphingobacteriales bacterium 50-39]|nr:MAG: hypothetical protein BGO55_01510 [Sphingobacteriales bacterium 50-39]